jgi:MFS family permease
MEVIMSDIDNPFQSPDANTEIVKPLVSQGALTDTMMKYLSDASPWLRFMGIMGFIGSGFMVLGGLVSIVIMPFIVSALEEASSFLSGFIGALSLMIVYALYMIGVGALIFFPALFTYRFGAKIRSYVLTNSEGELEQAFRNNRSLWKFNGILTIIGIAIIPVSIIIGIVVAVAFMAIGS